ncbi:MULTISPECIES: Eco57I restriction-modification methylase domain-containing protein [Streptomyces]|uniref:site-specific DNA-methyltransferase (adenine-specific) n=1 Tax=Streptomyces tsukubensis (strain DSM 42081 / NBRC 108919 / NRRL 18488 / 9993) TaxID=1114943 RepID=I2N3B6_STRT9|nr:MULTISPECIES: N-6 DNA methylase [Streptomyces]AZK95619.1 hypothetical protein B7R87_18470 [Streptomyces tsukubensis]EIF91513.1 DNA metyltransferase [Streptomyces tsukubensis NRRL18488]MYS68429.1 N-6 DNA methylase [Streptomyces sp. SID5473]QKM68346.1 DNA methyltransferase [Streptomyces tsukubensis NRRL18488]TAI43164.1 DNA methyltransferase [Streptomyces tsukubensis]
MATPAFDRVKRNGQHFTPQALAEFLAERVVDQLPRGRSLRIIDPACGDGELLLAANSVLSAEGWEVAELVGCELDPAVAAEAEVRMSGVIQGKVHVGDFLELAEDADAYGLFDLVITNPPYVRTQVLGAELSNALAARFGLKGRVDLTHAFMNLSTRLLNSSGTLALLCSNRFLTTKSGENIRRVLDSDFTVREIYDLGDTKLFKAAVLPAVVIAGKKTEDADASEGARFARVYEATDLAAEKEVSSVLESITSGASGVVSVEGKSYKIESGSLARGVSGAPWGLRTEESAQWLDGIAEGTWKTFGEIAKTRVGIKTTADAVFIGDDWEDLPSDRRPESEILLPLVTHGSVRPWSISNESATRVLYPYDLGKVKRELLPMTAFPKAMAYLLGHEERLRGRKYVVEGGRQWFEIWVPQRPALWAQPKIVFPDISEEARFALDTSGSVINGDCYWISFADLPSEDIGFLMLAVGNSKMGLRFYDTVCGNKLYSGSRRWITQYVDRLPLPDPSNPAAVRAIGLARELSETPWGTEAAETLRSRIESALEEAFSAEPDRAPSDEQPDSKIPSPGAAQESLF